MSRPSGVFQSLNFNVCGLIALANIKTIANRTAFTGTASFLDVLFIAPGIHCQQEVAGINQGEYPTTGALTSGYVFRVENQATVRFLQRVSKAGHLVGISVSPSVPHGVVAGGKASVLYLCGIALTVAVVTIMGTIHDWWGLGVLGMLMLARLVNVVIIKRRTRTGWKGAPEPDVHGDLLVLLSQDRWVRMRGLMDDLKAVTAGQWVRDETSLESFGTSFATLLVFTSAALTGNVSNIGGVLIAGLLLVSAALLGLCNALTSSLQMFGRIVSQVGPAKPYQRRLDLANELIEETGRDDWAIAMGMIVPPAGKAQKVTP
ncbi:hypothetical protein J3R83DRAFT_3925 [Lanmaoa asiatica]|nr:hypothetical protein J3R83DRAFT_3925 [Lanmaoa asiatica]